MALSCFMDLFQEALYSDITQMVLLTKSPDLIYKHKHLFSTFYEKMAKSVEPKEGGVLIDDFKRLCRHLFFKEDIVFAEFVREHGKNSLTISTKKM